MLQKKQNEWHEQWSLLQDDELFLFKDWIYPNTLDTFSGKHVLECGCGGGQHTSFVAPFAKSVTAVDLNTIDIALSRNEAFSNVHFKEADLSDMDLQTQYDVVFSIGVIHHTDDPDRTFNNIKKHVKSKGKLIVWVYSREGNFLTRKVVEPLRKLFLTKMSRKSLLGISKIITLLMYLPIYSLYKLPLPFLPYYEYFQNFRKMGFNRNVLNVFDKLNAPQVQFISRKRIMDWFVLEEFDSIHIESYKGVSWRASGVKK